MDRRRILHRIHRPTYAGSAKQPGWCFCAACRLPEAVSPIERSLAIVFLAQSSFSSFSLYAETTYTTKTCMKSIFLVLVSYCAFSITDSDTSLPYAMYLINVTRYFNDSDAHHIHCQNSQYGSHNLSELRGHRTKYQGNQSCKKTSEAL